MIPFEIHITASDKIHRVGQMIGIKTISVDLLRPDLSIIRTEHMTSYVTQAESYEQCKECVDDLVRSNLIQWTDVIRVKIESPYRREYIEQSLYIESHFITKDSVFPISRNKNKPDKLIGTARTYNKEEYNAFRNVWRDAEVELCLYDTFVEEDSDWFSFYE